MDAAPYDQVHFMQIEKVEQASGQVAYLEAQSARRVQCKIAGAHRAAGFDLEGSERLIRRSGPSAMSVAAGSSPRGCRYPVDLIELRAVHLDEGLNRLLHELAVD